MTALSNKDQEKKKKKTIFRMQEGNMFYCKIFLLLTAVFYNIQEASKFKSGLRSTITIPFSQKCILDYMLLLKLARK